jgi:hypothetical protein
MSPPHLYPILIILHFLNEVASFEESNLMTKSNLAVCFGPTLARLEVDDPAVMMRQVDRLLCENLLNITPSLIEALSAEQRAIFDSFVASLS